jgi:hypothetical protein
VTGKNEKSAALDFIANKSFLAEKSLQNAVTLSRCRTHMR